MAPLFNPFRIDWNTCTFGQWEALLARCKRPTLLQTWQYAMALAKTEGGKADFGIINFENKPVGLVQVQTRRWPPFLTTCRIYRGPLWIYDEISGEMLKLVLGMIPAALSPVPGPPAGLPSRDAGYGHRAQAAESNRLLPPSGRIRVGLARPDARSGVVACRP